MADLPTGTVTLLATDIGNSTEHWEHHSRAMSQALARHDAILQEAVASHGGHVFKTVGDGCYAVFAAATDALNAALAAQTRAYSSNLGYNWPFGVRVALHTGGVEQHNDCLIGMADIAVARGDSERAARLLGAAAPHLERMRGFMPLADRSSYTRVLSAVQAHLDEDVFAALAISSWRKSHAASRTHANRAGGCIDNLLLTWKLYQETTI